MNIKNKMFGYFIKKKHLVFKNVEQQREIDFFIPKKYTILLNNELPEISHVNNFNFSKIKSKKKQNSCDKIKNPYLKVYLKQIKENSKESKALNKQNIIKPFKKDNIISLKNEEKKNNDSLSFNSTFDSFKNSITNFNIFQTSTPMNNEILLKEDLDCKIFGIKNIGHTCYINSFLQILFRTPSFLKKLESENKSKDLLIKCLLNLSKYPENMANIRKLKNIMSEVDENYGKYTQKDSQEFGINLINKLISNIKGDDDDFFDDDDDDNSKDNYISFGDIDIYKNNIFKKYKEKYYKKENEIFLENMFQFHESRLIIDTDINDDIQIKKINFETNLNIELSFPSNRKADWFYLEELLNNKYPEYQKYYNEYNNEYNNNENNISIYRNWQSIKDYFYNLYKTFISLFYLEQQNMNNENDEHNKISAKSVCFRKLASLPNILIISINRAFLGKSLNTAYLQYYETLDLKNYIDLDIVHDKNTTYKLYAVNECSGIVKIFGHCYSYVKIKNRWFKFDDETIREEKPDFCSKYVTGLYYIRDNYQL